jgi:hypothetical protein
MVCDVDGGCDPPVQVLHEIGLLFDALYPLPSPYELPPGGQAQLSNFITISGAS